MTIQPPGNRKPLSDGYNETLTVHETLPITQAVFDAALLSGGSVAVLTADTLFVLDSTLTVAQSLALNNPDPAAFDLTADENHIWLLEQSVPARLLRYNYQLQLEASDQSPASPQFLPRVVQTQSGRLLLAGDEPNGPAEQYQVVAVHAVEPTGPAFAAIPASDAAGDALTASDAVGYMLNWWANPAWSAARRTRAVYQLSRRSTSATGPYRSFPRGSSACCR